MTSRSYLEYQLFLISVNELTTYVLNSTLKILNHNPTSPYDHTLPCIPSFAQSTTHSEVTAFLGSLNHAHHETIASDH